MNAEQEAWIVQAMSEPSFYDHPVGEVELIETHISWVFLAGDFAYKVKKPVNFGFLDFSTLSKRRHYCQEELRLNRRFAPEIYLEVKQIGGSLDAPAMDKQPALEYAVKMRRFPQNCQLDRMLAANQLHAWHIIAFATKIAELHQLALSADAGKSYGDPGSVIIPLLENFKQIRPLFRGSGAGVRGSDAGVRESDASEQLAKLEQWTRKSFENLKPALQQRKAKGFIRECHGDVHLANMAWVDDQPLLFDCIEFTENLRWIDVISDIAFLVMDLDDREQATLGWSFLNRYLQETGDYQGLALLNFYKVYRAMVRAKVISLRLAQGHLNETQRSRAEKLFQSYLALAEHYTLSQATPLIITHGFSGSGKTTFTAQLATVHGGIHIRSDIERKRLHGFAATDESESPIDGGLYSAQAFADTYSRLRDIAGMVLRSGSPAIVDATFIRQPQRELFSKLAEELHVPLIILDFPLAEEGLRRRIEQRVRGATKDASEATLEVLDYQLEHEEPLTTTEKQLAIRVHPNTTAEAVTASLSLPLDHR
ncbi:MAG: AAA family ATPase [Desulfuromonadales bacterium]|nr:AAA family ATPase [Desulfuromonadales bacterium]